MKCNDDYGFTLLFADDDVLLVETEQDLQVLLEALNLWCLSNNMNVNINKCDNGILKIVDTCSFTFLGVLLTEDLPSLYLKVHVECWGSC